MESLGEAQSKSTIPHTLAVRSLGNLGFGFLFVFFLFVSLFFSL